MPCQPPVTKGRDTDPVISDRPNLPHQQRLNSGSNEPPEYSESYLGPTQHVGDKLDVWVNIYQLTIMVDKARVPEYRDVEAKPEVKKGFHITPRVV
jgi:hypothetical protein